MVKNRFRQHMLTEILLDVGCTQLSALPLSWFNDTPTEFMDAIQPIGILQPEEVALWHSDFQRIGATYKRNNPLSQCDPFGVKWHEDPNSGFSPILHPIEDRHSPLPPATQLSFTHQGVYRPYTIFDAPVPGILGLAFLMRGYWNLLSDFAHDPISAHRILDWSTELVLQYYQQLFDSTEISADIVFYGDDIAFVNGTFLSEEMYRAFLFPKMRRVLCWLKNQSQAAILFHSCGDISPYIDDLVQLEIDILNVDTGIKNMSLDKLRAQIPNTMVLYGGVDLCEIGCLLRKGDVALLAKRLQFLKLIMPWIAATTEPPTTQEGMRDCITAITTLKSNAKLFEKLSQVTDWQELASQLINEYRQSDLGVSHGVEAL